MFNFAFISVAVVVNDFKAHVVNFTNTIAAIISGIAPDSEVLVRMIDVGQIIIIPTLVNFVWNFDQQLYASVEVIRATFDQQMVNNLIYGELVHEKADLVDHADVISWELDAHVAITARSSDWW